MLFSPLAATKIKRHARRGLLVLEHVLHIDPVARETLDRLAAEHVAADSRQERDLAAGSRRRHRLIRSFAAGGHRELPAQDRLARPRNVLHLQNHVRVRTAHHHDLTGHRGPPSSSTAALSAAPRRIVMHWHTQSGSDPTRNNTNIRASSRSVPGGAAP